jgi:hypothetical protein
MMAAGPRNLRGSRARSRAATAGRSVEPGRITRVLARRDGGPVARILAGAERRIVACERYAARRA